MKLSVHISSPLRPASAWPNYTEGLVEIVQGLERAKIPWSYSTCGTSPIAYARDFLVANFLSSPDRTHLVMIDGDIRFSFGTLRRMLDATEKHPIVGLGYRMRNASKTRYVPELIDSERVQEPSRGTIAVSHLGMGAVAFRRDALQHVSNSFAMELGYFHDGRSVTGMFTEICANGERLSEDISFCRRWQSLNGEVRLLLDANVEHAGMTSNYVKDVLNRYDD